MAQYKPVVILESWIPSLPVSGQTKILVFNEVHDPQRGKQWIAVEDVLLQGYTKYIVDATAVEKPSTEFPRWNCTVGVVKVQVNNRDQNLYHCTAFVRPFSKALSRSQEKKIGREQRNNGQSFNTQLALIIEKPRFPMIPDVTFFKNSDGSWTASRPCIHDDVVEMLIADLTGLEGTLPGGIRPRGDTRVMSLPVTVQVLDVIDDKPGLKIYRVRPVLAQVAQAS